jgi:hypothetical protein
MDKQCSTPQWKESWGFEGGCDLQLHCGEHRPILHAGRSGRSGSKMTAPSANRWEPETTLNGGLNFFIDPAEDLRPAHGSTTARRRPASHFEVNEVEPDHQGRAAKDAPPASTIATIGSVSTQFGKLAIPGPQAKRMEGRNQPLPHGRSVFPAGNGFSWNGPGSASHSHPPGSAHSIRRICPVVPAELGDGLVRRPPFPCAR